MPLISYSIDILPEARMLGCKLVDALAAPNNKLMSRQVELLCDIRKYRRLVRKNNNLIVTRLSIVYLTNVERQFMT